MIVAIPLHAGRVSPRFGNASEFLFVELQAGREVSRELAALEIVDPAQVAERLARRGVHLILSGGISPEFQKEFRLRNIAVIWGLIGEADDVLRGYLEGSVYAGMGPCPASLKSRSARAKKTRKDG